MRDILTEIWSTARRNKLRTALTGFAVAWGIFMIIFLLGAGNGLINAGEKNMGDVLTNSMIVYGGQTSKAYKGLKAYRDVSLMSRDVSVTSHNFTDHVDNVGPMMDEGNVIVSKKDLYFNGKVTGVYPNLEQINKIKMTQGRFIDPIDLSQRRKVIVLSDDNAKELVQTGSGNLVGQQVNVSNLAFTVVGVYKADQSFSSSESYIPYSTFKAIYNKGDSAGSIAFTFHGLKTEQQNKAFESTYRATVNMLHNAAPDDENALWIWNRFTQTMQMDQSIGIIRNALWVIGLFTLLSGIVGVSNIMLISVKERTREFGIRKAIGAKPGSILRLIVVESVLITTFFGFIGMLCGIAANQYMDATIGNMKTDIGIGQATMFVNPTVGFDVCFEALIVMIIAGTIAGIIPARRAARIRPIEALRAE